MGSIKLAVILAAGVGSRMFPYNKRLPKGFLKINGIPIIKRSIHNLLNAGIEKIIIGTGHKSKEYEKLASDYPVVCKYNPEYTRTGSMYTLYNMRESIRSNFLLLESDILYDGHGLEVLIKDPHPNIVLASGLTGAGDEVFIEANRKRYLTAMSKQKSSLRSIFGELTGISKVFLPAVNAMNKFAFDRFYRRPDLDYEYAMVAVSGRYKFYVLKIEDYIWCEIDDYMHLQRARNLIFPKLNLKEQASNHPL